MLSEKGNRRARNLGPKKSTKNPALNGNKPKNHQLGRKVLISHEKRVKKKQTQCGNPEGENSWPIRMKRSWY